MVCNTHDGIYRLKRRQRKKQNKKYKIQHKKNSKNEPTKRKKCTIKIIQKGVVFYSNCHMNLNDFGAKNYLKVLVIKKN